MPDDLEQLREHTTMLRRAAQQGFGAGVRDLIRELQEYAAAAESALGEISVDEAWGGLRRIFDERVPKE